MPYTSTVPGENPGSVAALTATFATEVTLTGGMKRGPTTGMRLSGFACWRTYIVEHELCEIKFQILWQSQLERNRKTMSCTISNGNPISPRGIFILPARRVPCTKPGLRITPARNKFWRSILQEHMVLIYVEACFVWKPSFVVSWIYQSA